MGAEPCAHICRLFVDVEHMSRLFVPAAALAAALAVLPHAVLPHAVLAQPATRDVPIRIEERQLRPAGIELARAEPEAGPAEIMLPGQIAVPPQQLRVIAAPAAGLIETLLVSPDERVREGQVVARLRSTELVEAQRLYLQASSSAQLAQGSLRRDEQLYRERVIAERRLLQTRAEAVGAAAALDERQQMLALLGMHPADIELLRSTRRISPTLAVTAPMAGVVLERGAVAGERVAQAAPLMTIAELRPLWVNIQVPLARANALGANARVLLPAQGAEGFILRVGRSADAATQSVTAVAEIQAGSEVLRPGQAVTAAVQLLANGAGGQWRVPAGAVIRHRERSWIFVRTPDGFLARPVTVLNETAQFTSIRVELRPGDQLAVRGILALLAVLAEADGG